MFCTFSRLLARVNSNSSSSYSNNSSNKQNLKGKDQNRICLNAAQECIQETALQGVSHQSLEITKSAVASPIGSSEKRVMTMDSTTERNREIYLKQRVGTRARSKFQVNFSGCSPSKAAALYLESVVHHMTTSLFTLSFHWEFEQSEIPIPDVEQRERSLKVEITSPRRQFCHKEGKSQRGRSGEIKQSECLERSREITRNIADGESSQFHLSSWRLSCWCS